MITKKIGLTALLLGFSAISFGQSFEAAVSGGPTAVSGGDLGSGYSLSDGFRLGFRITLNTRNWLGYEFGYAYNRTNLQAGGTEQGMAIHQGFGGALIYATGERARFRPFAAGGIHFSNFVPPGASAQYGQGENKFGFNYGAGLKVRLKGPFQLRFDARQYNQGKPFGLGGSGRFLLNEFSAGFGVVI